MRACTLGAATLLAGGACATPAPAKPAHAAALTAPKLSPVAMSHKLWRQGTRTAKLASKPTPVGVTFSFGLNTHATITLTFAGTVSGRKVKASLTFARGHAGLNKISFEGRLSPSRMLGPGHYTVTIVARNSAGEARAPGLTFTMLRA